MDNPQGAKEGSSTQYIFHVQDGTGLVTRLEAVGPQGQRRDVELPYPMTLQVPSAETPAGGTQTAAPHASPHIGGQQGTFLWSEVAGAPWQQPSTPGTGMGPAPGPQFTAAHGPAPGTHFAGMHAPHVAPPPGRTVKLQLTPPGFGHTMRLHPGAAPEAAVPGPAGGYVSGTVMAHPGHAHGPAMGPAHAPGTTMAGPQCGIVLAPYLGPAPSRPDNESGPRTQIYG